MTQSLYSPPNGGYPQELPDYWKFTDGNIRKDLQDLNDAALHNLGWTGPYEVPDYDWKTQNRAWIPELLKFVVLPASNTEIAERALIVMPVPIDNAP